MNAEDLILISVDDHVIEPPDMFEGRLPAKFADRAPRVQRLEDGTDAWLYEGEVLSNIGLNAVAGRPPEDFDADPMAFDDMRRACWDIHERVRDMDAGGVLSSLCFPTFPQFAGQLFARTKDSEFALAMVRAYNDWHVEDWAGTYPGRFMPMGLLPLWDANLMADEVRRLAAKGCHAVTFSENPHLLGLPSYHDDAWDPFWAACQETGTIICVHIGSSSQLPTTSPDAPLFVTFTLVPLNLVSAAADILWSPVFRKFPGVKFALSEGGIGWIPYFLERVDYVYGRQGKWLGVDFGDKLPSDAFHEHFVTCFITDEVGIKMRDVVGIDSICWESDYPHSDSTWPGSPEILAKALSGLPPDEVAKITHQNAMRHFQFDPLRAIRREDATVGALRARATDVDVTFRSTRQKPKDRQPGAAGLQLVVDRSASEA